MKNFCRALAGVLLCVVLLSFSLWRNAHLPNPAGIAAIIQKTIGRIDDIRSQLEVITDGTNFAKPSDQGAAFPDYMLSEKLDEGLEAAICNAYDNQLATIDVSGYGLTLDEVKAVVSQVCLSHPEYFYVAAAYQCGTTGYGSYQRVVSIQPTYRYDKTTVATMMVTYNAAVDAIVAAAPADGSDFEKLLYLHDYFVENYSYDYTYTIRDAYTFFVEKTGVCQAYMQALTATASKLGIESIPVTSASMKHAWNLVKLDGEWYHVDITWDDVVSMPSHTSYTYFLQSDAGLVATDAGLEDPHRDWQAEAVAQSTKYDAAVWRKSTTQILCMEGTYYCTVPVVKDSAFFGSAPFSSALYSGSDPTSMQMKKEISSIWYATENKSKYYLSSYADLFAWNGKLLYNTQNTIHIYDPATGYDQTILLSIPSNMNIYGIYDVSETGEITYMMDTKDMSGYVIYPTHQLAP